MRRSAETDVDVRQQCFEAFLPVAPHEHIIRLQTDNFTVVRIHTWLSARPRTRGQFVAAVLTSKTVTNKLVSKTQDLYSASAKISLLR